MDLIWWALIALLIIAPPFLLRKKKGVEVQGLFLLWRTQKGIGFVKKLARYEIFTKLADIGLIFAFGLFGAYYMHSSSEYKKPLKNVLAYYFAFVISSLILLEPRIFTEQIISKPEWLLMCLITGFGGLSLYVVIWATWLVITQLLSGVTPTPLLQPVIPGVKIPGAAVEIPLSAWVSLIIVLVCHEFSHGITAIRENLKLKSMGILTAGLLPVGAFAEPDEEQLKKTTPKKRLRVYTSGSMMNFVFTFLFILIAIPANALLNPMLMSNYYAQVTAIETGSPAALAGLPADCKIFNLDDLNSRVAGTPLKLVTDKGNYTVTPNATGSIGVSLTMRIISDNPIHWLVYYSLEIISWTAVLNFSVGMFNYLPFFIFDGARIFDDLAIFYAAKLGIKKKDVGKKALKVLSIVIGAMFIINLGVLFLQ